MIENCSRYLLHDKLFLEYQKEYTKMHLLDEIELPIKDNHNKVIYTLPLTIYEKSNNIVEINSYNNPISIDFLNLNSEENFAVHNLIKKLKTKKKINSILVKKEVDYDHFKKISNSFKNEIISTVVEKQILLEQEIKKIFKNFSKGHQSAIKKNYSNLNYEIYDKDNYQKDQIYEMMILHEKVANKKTRSSKSWEINEKMILNNMGFLIKVLEDGQTISYTFIFHDKVNALYFSSCTQREKFKLYNNITHKVIFKTIEYLKKKNCKHFSLGVTKTIYSSSTLEKKVSNIELFKSSFGGEKKYMIIYDATKTII